MCLDGRLVAFQSLSKMNQLIVDFQKAITVLSWRDQKIRQYKDPIFFNGLKFSITVVQENKIREILDSIDCRHLVYLLKLRFVSAESDFAKLLLVVISKRAVIINEALNIFKKKFEGR